MPTAPAACRARRHVSETTAVARDGSHFRRARILGALGGGAKRRTKTCFASFFRAAPTQPCGMAIMRRGAERYAGILQRRGVRRGEVVLIVLRHSPDLFSAFLGAMLIGAVPSFMPFPTSKQEPRLYWSSHQKLLDRMATGHLADLRGEPHCGRRVYAP
jgi:hypothetical protein